MNGSKSAQPCIQTSRKRTSRVIKHQNNDVKIASSREFLSQQKTLSQNTEKLQSTGKKKPFVRKKKELATLFHKLLFFPFFTYCVLHFLSLWLFKWSFRQGDANLPSGADFIPFTACCKPNVLVSSELKHQSKCHSMVRGESNCH